MVLWLLMAALKLEWPVGDTGVCCCSSAAQSCPTLQPHGWQHARLFCPSLSPGVFSNSCPLSQWCYLTISSSATPFSFCLQSFPEFESFLVSQLFASGVQSWSFSFSISPFNKYLVLTSFRIDWLDHLAVQGTLKSLLQHHGLKVSILWCSVIFMVQLSHLYMTRSMYSHTDQLLNDIYTCDRAHCWMSKLSLADTNSWRIATWAATWIYHLAAAGSSNSVLSEGSGCCTPASSTVYSFYCLDPFAI